MYDSYQMGLIIGSLGMGAVIGLIPAIVGMKRSKKGLAIAGFFSCIIGSYLLGLFLSVPLCVIFTFLILHSSKSSKAQKNSSEIVSKASSNYTTMFCLNCGSKLPDDVKFCPICGENLSSRNNIERQESANNTGEKPISTVKPHKKAIKFILATILALVVIGCLARFIYIKTEYPNLTFEEYMKYRNLSKDTIPVNVNESITIDVQPITPIILTYEDCQIQETSSCYKITYGITVKNLRSKKWKLNTSDFISYADGSIINSPVTTSKISLKRDESAYFQMECEVPLNASMAVLEYHTKCLFGAELIIQMYASGNIVSASYYNSAAQDSQQPEIVISASTLYAEYDANSVSANEKYAGKYIEVTDIPIYGINPTDSGMQIASWYLDGFFFCYYNFSNIPSEASNITTDSKISIIGYVQGYNSGSIRLSDCRFATPDALHNEDSSVSMTTDGVFLTNGEMADITEYFNDTEHNGLLRFPYDGISDPDMGKYLSCLFYDLSDDTSVISDTELMVLRNLDIGLYGDVYKLSTDYILKYLSENFGEDRSRIYGMLEYSFGQLGTYLTEYDAYYNTRYDTAWTPYEFDTGSWIDDDTVRLHYVADIYIASKNGELDMMWDQPMYVDLRPRDNGGWGWYIIRNCIDY